jgi:Cys-tRNA(Pro)/Cys-tRNA(Cys) deacylase
MTRTNVMRLLDEAGITYTPVTYSVDDDGALTSGLAVRAAMALGLDADVVFKTLVLRGASGACYVCCVPAAGEVSLKKVAAVTGEKSVAMLHVAELLPLTGYIRGACSPIGMKRRFPVFIDETATLFDAISISAGRRGVSVLVRPAALIALARATTADITA